MASGRLRAALFNVPHELIEQFKLVMLTRFSIPLAINAILPEKQCNFHTSETELNIEI